jgi:hypothetical protein
MRRIAIFAVAAFALPAHAEPLTGKLELACIGGGAANKPDVATMNAWNSNGGYASAQAQGTRTVVLRTR